MIYHNIASNKNNTTCRMHKELLYESEGTIEKINEKEKKFMLS